MKFTPDHERKARDLCRTLRIWRSRRVPTYDPDDPFDTVIEIRPEVMNVLAQALADAEAEGRRKAFEEKVPRKPGCLCQWEEGDSPCPVHGEDEERP